LAKHLIVLLGPTAVGKTNLSIQIAQYLKCDVISADARQIFKELNIGVAKPSKEELGNVTHHFVGKISVKDNFNAGIFEKEALCLLNELFKKDDHVVMVGGSGLYINAVCNGFDNLPEVDETTREQLNSDFAKRGIKYLQEELKELDPDYYQQVDLANPRRLIRALEVCMITGEPYSSFRKKQKANRPFDIIKIGLEVGRQELYEKIDDRVDAMLENGLVEEVISLGKYKDLPALQTIGYTEIFQYLDKKTTLEDAINEIKKNSRRYAKRQITWFRKDKEIKWFHPKEEKRMMVWLKQKLK